MQDQAQFFVGLGTLSLINAGLAQSKGRRGLLWWLISLFFGPLATLLIVVLPVVPPVPSVLYPRHLPVFHPDHSQIPGE